MRRRRLECWAWAAPVCLAGLLVLVFWPYVLLSEVVKLKFIKRAATVVRRAGQAVKALESRSVRGFFVFIALILVIAAWAYSQAEPKNLGSCHEIALYFGPQSTTDDCQPYSAPDLVIAIGAILAIGVAMGGGEINFSIPGLGEFSLTRKAREAIHELEREEPDLEQRLAGYETFREARAREVRQQEGASETDTT